MHMLVRQACFRKMACRDINSLVLNKSWSGLPTKCKKLIFMMRSPLREKVGVMLNKNQY